jgi:hypothetical protein
MSKTSTKQSKNSKNFYREFEKIKDSSEGKVLKDYLLDEITQSMGNLLRSETYEEMTRLRYKVIANLSLYQEIINAEKNAEDFDKTTEILKEAYTIYE